MATSVQTTQQNDIAYHIRCIQDLLPNVDLPEPHRGAIEHAVRVTADPSVDRNLCTLAGKVVQITVHFAHMKDHPVVIRGNTAPLGWETDLNADVAAHAAPDSEAVSLYTKTYTFPVAPNQIDSTIEFKFFDPQTNAWSAGNNWTVDLSKFGHIARLTVSDVAF